MYNAFWRAAAPIPFIAPIIASKARPDILRIAMGGNTCWQDS